MVDEKEGRRVAIVHPDLGLGGAERLVVDAALGLQERGHKVVIYTAYRDVQRCFPEVRPRHLGGSVSCTLVNTYVPRSVLGRFHALCTVIQCVILALYVCVNASRVDVAFCDIVSAPALIFRMFGIPCIFYCHFPDQMLADSIRVSHAKLAEVDSSLVAVSKRFGRLVYRAFVDRLERFAISRATCVAVNSQFTARMFSEVYPDLLRGHERKEPIVVYPAVNIRPSVGHDASLTSRLWATFAEEMFPLVKDPILLVSLNRFEKKKNVALAVRALHAIRSSDSLVPNKQLRDSIVLLIAGGYDDRLEENKQTLHNVRQLISELRLEAFVGVELNFDESKRISILRAARALLYTPSSEHFGIVPLEAMAAGVPVIAVDSGGPRETVQDQATGFLCPAEPAAFAQAAARLVVDQKLAEELGKRGRERAQSLFSVDALGTALEGLVHECCDAKLARTATKPSSRKKQS
ncbi:Alpha-1,3/1,6-mannosyltransferase ALG2 [Porphyridium purpureum]|uniref:Alpha-1,3/1,6-mannosyltransferase ALG2 n=1 Tax=Porphyridium purpureum TaxID=35688 RepID=A0A5J4YVU9_PORPP|nr:Alpha-1,3/1,6-mannosyltransferase ALG2 [Porphyridium purpureum]|eukprot:POR2595..scf227_4